MSDFQTLRVADIPPEVAASVLLGCVVPRPIAWVTTVNAQGMVNAAPFSGYNFVSNIPPMIAVSIAARADGLKDTARNITDSGHFVVNVATESMRQLMHSSSADYLPDQSETELLDIELIPSEFIASPRIAASPVHMECTLDQVISLSEGRSRLFIGNVVAFHLSRAVFDGRRVDSFGMRPLARLAGPLYATLGEVIRLQL
jgi:flavin reductase (DIM6/NTAB) family NADH-FMN oxidoreductase RutF